MAGLIGSSNSPISAVGILAILSAALMLAGLFGRDNGPDVQQALVAYALIVTSLVFGVATISNDNLQDLKTGHLVSATPWRQQVALILGVVFGSLIVPRSEEHTSELQSLMRISYAVFCLKKKTHH